MREIFYGAAIQGAVDRAERAPIHKRAIQVIQEEGFRVLSEHTSGETKEKTALLLKEAIGEVPEGMSRKSFIRRAMLGFIDSHLNGIVFEVSIPSTGTGIEIGYACTRAQRGLLAVPILALYQTDYWPSGLSTMVNGIEEDELPNFNLVQYKDIFDMENSIRKFLGSLRNDPGS